MAIPALSLARISNNLRAYSLSEAIRLNQLGLYRTQTALSTGYRFQQPSEDPVRSAGAVDLTRRLDWMSQVHSNLSRVGAALTETDTAMQETMSLLTEAHSLAVQAVGDSMTPEERHALTVVADSLIDRLVAVANRKHLNTYLFAGEAGRIPFEREQNGVVYYGDDGRLESMVDTDREVDEFTVPGSEFFRSVSSQVTGVVDLDPALTGETLISDLAGALGSGVELGRIRVDSGDSAIEIDLAGVATVKNLVDKLNSELPDWIQAGWNARGLTFTRLRAGTETLTISDVSGGRTAADLGLAGTFDGQTRAVVDLDPRVTRFTRLGDLAAGAGLNLSGGIVINNGGQTATVQFDGLNTVEDLLNAVNRAGIGVWARVGSDGQRLDILSRVSGADLTIAENGGTAATALGIRSLYAGTRVAELNEGLGVITAEGADLRIALADGSQVDVDIDGATTLQDVIDRINAAAGGRLTAGLAATGNGLLLTDNTTGGSPFGVSALNGSEALHGLGLEVAAVANQITGRDVNPVRVDGPFTALLELKAGMESDNRTLMMRAGARLDRVMKGMQEVQGRMAARARAMDDRTARVENEITATQVLLSDVRDVDLAEAAVRFQQLQTALQANLATASRVMNLSLLDYLTTT